MPNFYDSWRSGGTGRGAYTLEARTATEVPLTLTGAASQSANYLLIQDSASTAILTINSSGNVTIANDLTVSGSTNITIDEAVSGNLTLTGALTVNGNSTLGNASTDTTTITGDVTMNNALDVTGIATFANITSGTVHYLRRRASAPGIIGSNGALYTREIAGITELFYLDSSGTAVQVTSGGGVGGSAYFVPDDTYYRLGNTAATPDAAIGWNTAQTVDGVYFGLSDAQNTFVIAEYGDRTFDFAHGAATNPTIFIHSAAQSTTQYVSVSHNQTDGVILTGAGALVVNATAFLPDANDAYAIGASGTGFSDFFLASGAVINFLAGDATITHAAGLLTLNVDLTITGDLLSYEAVNDANPEIRLGATDAEEAHIQSVFDAGAQTLDYVLFQTDAASAAADKGQFIFNVDGTQILSIDDGGLEIDVASGTIIMSGLTISGGTNTFNLTNGTASLDVAAGSAVNIDASLTVSGVSTVNQDVSTTGDPTFGNLTITSFAANWTNASRTVADLGVVTTVDINGGTLDGVTIGGASAAAATVTTLTGSTAGNVLTITNTSDAASVQAGIIQGDRATVADGDEAYLTLSLSDSAGTQDEGARITWKATTVLSGATQDTDLILSALVNNVLTTMLTLDGSAGQLVPVAINAAGVTSPDLGTVTTIDINGGTIDGVTIGGAAAGAITGTTIDATTDFTIGGLVITDGTLTDDAMVLTQTAGSTGATGFTFNIGAHTAITAATERRGINVPAVTKTWAAGAGPLAAQREVVFLAPTYVGNAGGALTITDSATVYIDGAPVQSTNITLSNTYALWVDGGAVRMDGVVYINDTANANIALGLTINMGANDAQFFAGKSSDVAHGMTTFAETDTFFAIEKTEGDGGGAVITGWSDANATVARPITIRGYSGIAADATKSTAAEGLVNLRCAVISGAGRASPAADSNLVTITDDAAGTTQFIFDLEGSGHQNLGTAWAEFDDYDDGMLLETLNATIVHDPLKGQFREFTEVNKDILSRNRIITYNDDGQHFINWSRANMLTIGAVRQLYKKLEEQALKITKLEQRLLSV